MNFWKDRQVLVTGAGGFIASHLVQALIAKQAKVRALVHYNSRNHWGWLDTLSQQETEDLEIITGDIRDPNGMRLAVADCQSVFHLAALIGIPYSYHSPDAYLETNVRGTLNILQATRDAGTERVLLTSTSEVYGTAQNIPINETHPRQAQSPYSATKIAADALAESFHLSFDLPLSIVRPFNTYGPRQSARAFIPTVITQALNTPNEIQLGSLSPTRDLVFVQDTVAGFLAIAESQQAIGQDINIATGNEISMADLAQKILQKIGIETNLSHDSQRTRPEKSEVQRLCGDNTKLFDCTGWTAQYDIDQGLDKTIDWFRENENRSGYKSQLYNV